MAHTAYITGSPPQRFIAQSLTKRPAKDPSPTRHSFTPTFRDRCPELLE